MLTLAGGSRATVDSDGDGDEPATKKTSGKESSVPELTDTHSLILHCAAGAANFLVTLIGCSRVLVSLLNPTVVLNYEAAVSSSLPRLASPRLPSHSTRPNHPPTSAATPDRGDCAWGHLGPKTAAPPWRYTWTGSPLSQDTTGEGQNEIVVTTTTTSNRPCPTAWLLPPRPRTRSVCSATPSRRCATRPA